MGDGTGRSEREREVARRLKEALGSPYITSVMVDSVSGSVHVRTPRAQIILRVDDPPTRVERIVLAPSGAERAAGRSEVTLREDDASRALLTFCFNSLREGDPGRIGGICARAVAFCREPGASVDDLAGA